MTPVYAELHRWMSLPFIWGETDCILVLCDWVARVTGKDPGAQDRFTYDDAGSCQRATGFFTDPLGLLDDRLARVGICRGEELKTGDIALIRIPGERRPVGALWAGDCWGCKGPDGTTTLRPDQAEIIAFWSVPYEA